MEKIADDRAAAEVSSPEMKPRLFRLHRIDALLRQGGFPNATTLAEVLEVCSRTVQRDIEFLRDRMDAPVEFDRRRNGYYYTEPTFSLPAMTLREDELQALGVVRRYLESSSRVQIQASNRGHRLLSISSPAPSSASGP
jgi:predicted DNA-binding transcriptional regulator YafY